MVKVSENRRLIGRKRRSGPTTEKKILKCEYIHDGRDDAESIEWIKGKNSLKKLLEAFKLAK